MVLAGLPQQGHTSLRCSCSNGMQRLDRPTSSFIFISQARSPHHMVLIHSRGDEQADGHLTVGTGDGSMFGTLIGVKNGFHMSDF